MAFTICEECRTESNDCGYSRCDYIETVSLENLRHRTDEVVNVWAKGHSKHEEEWCQRPDVDSVCGGRVVSIEVTVTVELVCCGVMVEGDASNVCGGIPCSVVV